MDVTLAQVDIVLAEWRQKVDAANQNLLELYDLPAYQRVSGMGNPPTGLMGTSQQRVGEALTAIERLFEDLELLNQTIDRARKLRQELPSLFISQDRLQEIYQLLTGASIQLQSIHTPLAQRDLLTPNLQVRSISATDLLERMMYAFRVAADTLGAVDLAWTRLESQLVTSQQELTALQQLAQRLQVPVSAALGAAQANFSKLQLEIDRDPLGVELTVDRELKPLLSATRRELESLAQQRQQLQSDLATAKRQLQELRQLNQDAIAAASESQAKIKHDLPLGTIVPDAEIVAMEQWLVRLLATFEAGKFVPASVGLANWVQKICEYLSAARATLAANQLPLATRLELRGRVDALGAKALAKGKAEDPVLADLAIRARQGLYSSPTDLTEAIDLVKQYELRLNQLLTC
jgi:flagellar motor switch/type III secretory pathway protein FliN